MSYLDSLALWSLAPLAYWITVAEDLLMGWRVPAPATHPPGQKSEAKRS